MKLHPVDRLIQEKGTTRYRVCLESGLSKNVIQNYAARSTPIDSIPAGTLYSIAKCLGMDLNAIYDVLKQYEQEMQ